MKKGMSILMGAAALLAAGVLSAQEVKTFNKAADWNKSPAITDGEDCLKVSKNVMLVSPRFKIDPDKTYTIKLSVRAENIQGKDFSWCLAGFAVFDKKGVAISCDNVNVVNGTLTTVAADAAKGTSVLTVKDASKVKSAPYYTIVAGAKEDLSDLPNRKVLARGIQKVEKKGDVWEITVRGKLSADAKAGDTIRIHSMGGYLYTAGSRNVRDKWTVMQGKIKGYSQFGWAGNKWPVGAEYAQFIILANWGAKKLETQFKDVSLTIE